MMVLKTIKISDKTRDAFYNALRELATIDDDFNGKNGDEYLWDEAKESGYQSNLDFLINEIIKKETNKTDEELVQLFIGQWIDSDDYYKSRSFHVYCDKDGIAEFIALAIITGG